MKAWEKDVGALESLHCHEVKRWDSVSNVNRGANSVNGVNRLGVFADRYEARNAPENRHRKRFGLDDRFTNVYV